MRQYSGFIEEFCLRDLPLYGGLFMWSGGLNSQSASRPISDHCPIVLEGGGIRMSKTLFRFENMWLKAEGFKYLIRSWQTGYDARGSSNAVKLKALIKDLKLWNKEVFGNVLLTRQRLSLPSAFRILKREFLLSQLRRRRLKGWPWTSSKSGL